MTPERNLDVLSASPLFRSVDLAVLEKELDGSRALDIPAGEVLLDPGVGNEDIYIVLDGELLVCLEPRLNHPLACLKEGDCVGELSIIDARPPSAYVLAAVDCRLLAIPKEVLWQMLAKQQAMALNLLHILTRRIRENNAILLSSLELQREYRNRAETDPVTGLHNRNWLNDVYPKQIELSERIGQRVSLLLLDIDHFKRVNDAHGHLTGDEALRHIGQLVRRNLRSTDLCARFGGEEITVLMPATDALQARQMADRLRGIIAATPLVLDDGSPLSLTVSGGIVEWQPGLSFEALVRAADQAMYRAKAAGRNRIEQSRLGTAFELKEAPV